MIFTDKAAKEKISTLETRLADLEADISTKDASIEALTADITAKDQTIAENVAAIAARDEQITGLSTDLATANLALESAAAELVEKDKAIADAKESAGKEAAQILATIGQPEPLDIESAPSADPVAAYIAAVESGDSKLRAEIFEKHKAAIMAYRSKLNQ
jgi:chromosome segregation ATPase